MRFHWFVDKPTPLCLLFPETMKTRLAKILFLAAVALGTLWAYLRLHTYATGQDPRTFLLMAKGMLGGASPVDSRLVVPGWPLVLAGVMKLFGPHAAFWTNVPLFVMLVWALQALLEEMTGGFRRSAAMAAGAVLLVLGGYPLNPHFLLWAFRQTPMYLAGILAWLCLVRAVKRQSEGRLAAAAAWLLAALAATVAGVLVRETGLLLLPPMGLYLLAVALGWAGPLPAASQPARSRWFLFSLAAGIGLAALCAGALAVWYLRLPVASGQVSFLLEWAPWLLSRPFRDWPLRVMLDKIPAEFGWLGVLALLLGVGESFRRRNRDFLFVFLLPALAYLLFDGLIKFHWRFFLSTLFFLAPLAMLGAVASGEWLARMAGHWISRKERRTRAAFAARAAVWIALAVWCARIVLNIPSWALTVTRADVDRALAVLATWTAPDRPLLLDDRTRYLADVLEVFTDWPLERIREESVDGYVREPPLVFVQPTDQTAIYRFAGLPSRRADAILENHLSLKPLPGEPGFSLGTSTYRLMHVLPWTLTHLAIPLPPPPEPEGPLPPPCILLRLTVPVGAAGMGVRVSLGNHPLLERRFRPGGWYLAVPWSLLETLKKEVEDGNAAWTLVLDADAPIPDDFQAVWMRPDSPLEMSFAPKQEPSFASYLSWDGQDGTISLPAGLDGGMTDADLLYIVKLAMGARCGDDEGTLAVSLSLPEFPDVAPQTVVRPHSARQQIFRFVLDGLPRAPERLGLHVAHEPGNAPPSPETPHQANVSLDTLQLYTLRRPDTVSVQVGTSGDALLLGDGFFSRESPGSSRHGRWTGGEFDFFLPLKGGRDYRLELDYDQLRPEGTPPAELQLELNGHPLETAETDTGLEARIPAEWLEGPESLILRTPTWSPADHGAGDTRRLGVYVRAFRVAPIGTQEPAEPFPSPRPLPLRRE